MSSWVENGDYFTLVRGLDGVTFTGSGGVSTFKIFIHPPEWNRLMGIVQAWQERGQAPLREKGATVTDPNGEWDCKVLLSTFQFEWRTKQFQFKVDMSKFMTAHLKETYRKTTKLELLMASG